MKKQQKAKILNRIFEEIESVEYSTKELDQNLKEINIDPNKLVENGINRIEKILKKKENKAAPIRNLSFNKFQIAATKKSKEINIFKKKSNSSKKKK